jgi:hypothetical protein
MEISTFERKTFRVRAVQITSLNFPEVADWCGGVIRLVSGDKALGGLRRTIVVPTSRFNGQVMKINAFEHDWVSCLTEANHFKVYQDKAFREAFAPSLSTTERRDAILELLEEMTGQQGHQLDPFHELVDVKSYTKTIMELFEGAS